MIKKNFNILLIPKGQKKDQNICETEHCKTLFNKGNKNLITSFILKIHQGLIVGGKNYRL